MFYHAVLMQLADSKPADFDPVVEGYIARIRAECAGVRSIHYGRNVADRGRDFDCAVIGVFESSAHHDAYQVSPAHVELRDYMMPHVADIVVADLDVASDTGAGA